MLAGRWWRSVTLGAHVPGGWGHIHAVAGAAGKFHMLNFALNLTQTLYVLGGGAGWDVFDDGDAWDGPVDGAADAGGAESGGVAAGAAVVGRGDLFSVHAVSADRGGALCVLWRASGGFRTKDCIFPTFIVREMPVGIAGLLVAAILAAAMSNLSAALNSLSRRRRS